MIRSDDEDINILEIWQSLFQKELCSKVKNVPSEIIGPILLIERTIVSFKEICFNYISAVKEVGAKNLQLDCVSKELNILREELHETQKPCENCETLSRELSFAKKRANDAEFRVTQIAKILGPASASQEYVESNKSPTDSPKRKRSCFRDKEKPCVIEANISSQTVEIGYLGALLSPVPNKDIGFTLEKWSPKKSKSPKNKSDHEKTKRLSRSIELEGNHSKINPRRNLSAEFDNNKKNESPIKSNSFIDPSKPSPSDKKSPGNGPNGSFAEKYGSVLDKLWFGDETSASKKNKEVKQTHNSDSISKNTNSKSLLSDSHSENRKRKKCVKPTRSDKVIKNPDNSYDLVLKKELKKKHIQLTLQMIPSNKPTEKPDSDSDDLVLPSPEKEFDCKEDGLPEVDDLELTFNPGVTSTQKPDDGAADDAGPSSLIRRKTPSPAKKRNIPLPSSTKQLDNSFDVVLDKRKRGSPNYKYKGKTVRGKARAKLQGWDCEECQKFYELACKNQSPSKVKAKMNMCSRHRSKHKQTRPPTPPGFWDLDIPDTPE